MHGQWLSDIESLEAISQDESTRRLFLRMANLSQSGRLQLFLRELDADGDLDPATKLSVAELAQDASFLHVGEGAIFIFGDEESPNVNATISGGVVASNANSVQIHFSTLNGGVVLDGGSGPFPGPFDFGGGFAPTWTTLEDNTINGAVKITG